MASFPDSAGGKVLAEFCSQKGVMLATLLSNANR
jgi:hypothetical protein